jgi:hypothetical protein
MSSSVGDAPSPLIFFNAALVLGAKPTQLDYIGERKKNMIILMKNFGLSLKLGAATDLLLENTGIEFQLYTPQ